MAMVIEEALAKTTITRLDQEILLGYAMEADRSWLVAHPEAALTQAQKSLYLQMMKRRMSGEPLAYITGCKEFYGRTFHVNPSVLIPRPSTEGLIDLVLDFLRNGEEEIREVDTSIVAIAKKSRGLKNIGTIVDIGTGSGCIAITLALELPNKKIIATDINEEALEVAKDNAKLHGVSHRVQCRFGKYLEPIEELAEPFLVVSNPPYIPQDEKLQSEVHYEPRDALLAGKDGMDVIRMLMDAANDHPLCGGVIMECRKEQAYKLDVKE